MDPFSSLSIAAAVVQFIDFGARLVAGTLEIYRSEDGHTDDVSELAKRTERLSDLMSSLTSWNSASNKISETANDSRAGVETNVDASAGLLDIQDQQATYEGFLSNPVLDGPTATNKYRPEQACRKLTNLAASLDTTQVVGSHSKPVRRSETEVALLAMAEACKVASEDMRQAISKLAMHKKSHRGFNSFRQALQSAWGKRKLKNMEWRLEKYRTDLALHLVAIIKYVPRRQPLSALVTVPFAMS
jgi:hypothetical protein